MTDDCFYNKVLYEFYKLSNENYLYENLNEGLIKSYSIDDVKRWLENDLNFQCINKVKVLTHNTYESKKKAVSDNEFVEILLKTDPQSVLSYEKVINSCYCLLGWFTGAVSVKITQRNGGFRTYTFFRSEPYKTEYDYKNCFFSEDTHLELKKFLIGNMHSIYGVSIIIEEKFPIKQYKYYDDEIFYHKTDKKFIKKITENGLVPKSRFNYPSRIYLTNNIENLDDTRLNINDDVILKIKLSRNQKVYMDQRSSGFFTYENISPDEIEVIKL